MSRAGWGVAGVVWVTVILIVANVTRSQEPASTEETPEARRERIEGLRRAYAAKPEHWPPPQVDELVKWVELGPLPKPTFLRPEDDPETWAKVELGKRLFFDPRLSGSGQIACASCHDPDLGWADGRTTSFGDGRTRLGRNAPGLLNAGMVSSLFWDGRAASLEEQAKMVILNPSEMNAPAEAPVKGIAAVAEYRPLFARAFGSDAITLDSVARALAAFERTLVGGRSRFDAFLRGETKALSDEAVAGLDLFRGRARCLNCHHGPTLSDGQFHDLGLSYYGRLYEDLGRYRITGAADDVGRFRTPSLRNVTATKPYMHNGLFELEGVLRMYNAGMPTLRPKEMNKDEDKDKDIAKDKNKDKDAPPFPTKSAHLRPLKLNARELADLKAFLESLAEPRALVRPPALPGL